MSIACKTAVSFAVENWAALWSDGQALFPKHWRELATDQNRIELALDEDTYTKLDAIGNLHVLTVRSDGKLVGYYLAFLMVHPHYKTAGLMAMTDIYYLLPEFRGVAGVQLFIEVARTLKERGVKKAYLSCKLHQDHSRLFNALGWESTDVTFTKYLG